MINTKNLRLIEFKNLIRIVWDNDGVYITPSEMFKISGDYQVSCKLIIGKRKENTNKKTSLNHALRENNVTV
tara:strand:- start:258 stop:473 length:216 start_codon:yes stop_codon:yes gene_type:complete